MRQCTRLFGCVRAVISNALQTESFLCQLCPRDRKKKLVGIHFWNYSSLSSYMSHISLLVQSAHHSGSTRRESEHLKRWQLSKRLPKFFGRPNLWLKCGALKSVFSRKRLPNFAIFWNCAQTRFPFCQSLRRCSPSDTHAFVAVDLVDHVGLGSASFGNA